MSCELSSGTFKLECAANNQVLDVPHSNVEPGTKLITYSWHGGNNQKWIAKDAGNGYTLSPAVDCETVLDESDSAPGEVILWEHKKDGGENQQWLAVPVSDQFALIKNVKTGQCLYSTGSGHYTTTAYENPEDKNMLWSITPV